MELIGYYLLFAFSTSITACIFWFWPLLQQAREQKISNTFTQSPKTSVVVYIILSAVVAPVLVFPLLNSRMAEQFQAGLAKEILKPGEEI